MNLGLAVKTLRKEKGYSQKEFAERCGLSVNALCQIEVNSAFPKKNTIKRICDELSIPTAYLLFLSIDEEDVPEDRRRVFKTLSGPIREILLER